MIAGVAIGWNVANVGAVAAAMADSYGIALASVGLFTTALFLTHMAMQVPGGRLADRFGARRVCLAGMAIIVCGSALAMVAPVVELGLGARALTGVGTGLGFVSGSAYVRRCGGSPFAQGLYGGIGLAAGGVALALVPQLLGELSWRAPFATALALALVALAVLVVAPADHGDRPAAAGGSPAGVLSDTGLYPLALLFSATFGITVVLSNWVAELLERDGVGEAGLIGSLILVLGVISRPLGGWIVRQHGPRLRSAVGLSLLAGGLGSALLGLVPSTPGALVGCALLGIGGGISFSPAFTGAAMLRPDAPGAAVGFVNATAATTILVCTPLVGLTFSLPGDGRIGFAAATLAWAGALAALPDRRSLGG